MPAQKARKREQAIESQKGFCFFCWLPMLEPGLELPDSARLFTLDDGGAPWQRRPQRFVAAHNRCCEEVIEMRGSVQHAYAVKNENPIR